MTDQNLGGRPSVFSAELANVICDRLAEGEGLREICRSEDMPSKSTVFRWLLTNTEFRDQYSLSRDLQADILADDIIEISDNATNDWMERRSEAEKGAGVNTGWVLNGEHVQRSKLRVEARKWVASKVAPKKYGDRIATEHSGPAGGPIQTVTEIKRTLIDPKS